MVIGTPSSSVELLALLVLPIMLLTVSARRQVAELPKILRALGAAPLRRIPLLRLRIRAQRTGPAQAFLPVTVVQVVATLTPHILPATLLRVPVREHPLLLDRAANLKPRRQLQSLALLIQLANAPIVRIPTERLTLQWICAGLTHPPL